jgi:hypothetical protein
MDHRWCPNDGGTPARGYAHAYGTAHGGPLLHISLAIASQQRKVQSEAPPWPFEPGALTSPVKSEEDRKGRLQIISGKEKCREDGKEHRP